MTFFISFLISMARKPGAKISALELHDDVFGDVSTWLHLRYKLSRNKPCAFDMLLEWLSKIFVDFYPKISKYRLLFLERFDT